MAKFGEGKWIGDNDSRIKMELDEHEEYWRSVITNPNWKKEIRCPYCKHSYVDVHQLSNKLYMFSCPECSMNESWLEEYNLYTTYEEGLDIYGKI